MRSQSAAGDRQFAVVRPAMTIVAASVVFATVVSCALVWCTQINANKEVRLAQIVVGQTTRFDYRMQLDSRQLTTVEIPRLELARLPVCPEQTLPRVAP